MREYYITKPVVTECFPFDIISLFQASTKENIVEVDMTVYSGQAISVGGKAEKDKTFVLPQGEYQIKLK